MSEKPKQIMMLLPHPMVARNVLHTEIINYLKTQRSAEITIISKNDVCSDNTYANSIKWQPICRPFKVKGNSRYLWSDIKLIAIYTLHMMVAYRFNSIKGFNGFKIRTQSTQKSLLPKWNEGHALSPWCGFPFCKSVVIYNFLYKILNSSRLRHNFVKEQFDLIKPDKLFIIHMQIANIIPYLLEAKSRNIPIEGMIGSWDQPSTKGAVCSGFSKILVCNQRLKDELINWHNIDANKIYVVGWPQMDVYFNSPKIFSRQKYILCGAYSQRLGAHEPEIFQYIAESIESGTLDSNLKLYIRAHPLDNDWENRLTFLKRYACVIIEPPSLDNLEHLSQLIYNAGVVLASAGTILLDAIAHDKPAIAMAYASAELMAREPHIRRRYEMEHLEALMKSGAIIKATSNEMLVEAIKNSFNNPEQYKNERIFVHKNWLEPFDGKAAQRIAEAICV